MSTDLMTMREVADEYPWSEATLRDWRFRAIGPRSARIGRRVFYRRADIEKFLSEQFEAEAKKRVSA